MTGRYCPENPSGEAVDQILFKPSDSLVGIGLYTLAEAGRLVQVAPAKIARWLRGHARTAQVNAG